MSHHRSAAGGLKRRDLMKLGAGVVATTIAAPSGQAQSSSRWPDDTSHPVATRYGYVNDYNRHGHNGPMDDTTRKIVKFVKECSASNLKESTFQALNRTMVDSMPAAITGFEGESVRIAARMASQAQPAGPKCTVLGYGLTTTPELAAFANSCMVRHTDFNDHGPAGHTVTIAGSGRQTVRVGALDGIMTIASDELTTAAR